MDLSESRARILAAARKIFSEKGLEGARVDEIAECAKINKRMLYHYFGNKEDLYTEVLRRNLDIICQASLEGYDEDGDPVEIIKRVISNYFYFLASNEDYVRLINWEALNRGKYVNKVLSEARNAYQKHIDQVLRAGMQKGVFSPDIDVEQVILSIDALCLIYFSKNETFQRLWQNETSAEAMLKRRLEHILNFVFEGILRSNK